jgi:hypothetical protein
VRCVYSVQVSALPAGQQLRVTKGDELVGYFAGGGQLRVAVSHSGRGYDNGVEFNGSGAYQLVATDGTSNRSPATTLVIPRLHDRRGRRRAGWRRGGPSRREHAASGLRSPPCWRAAALNERS